MSEFGPKGRGGVIIREGFRSLIPLYNSRLPCIVLGRNPVFPQLSIEGAPRDSELLCGLVLVAPRLPQNPEDEGSLGVPQGGGLRLCPGSGLREVANRILNKPR
jgi:hypothetical protein